MITRLVLEKSSVRGPGDGMSKDLASAVEAQIERNNYAGSTWDHDINDKVRTAQGLAEANTRFLGQLVQTLHTSGALSEEQVLGLLDNFVKVE